ncbi:MAG: pilus assembly protein HicB [Paludibacter sp.]|jgi:hypothetical protein|nr:pilus assembly protein HicB [Paludibacter sp.]
MNTNEATAVDVIVERGNDGRYSAFMDYYEFDFGLAGFGKTAQEAIEDFYQAYNEERRMCEKENKTVPELIFNIKYDVSAFLDTYTGILSKSGLEKITGINQKQLWHYTSGRRAKPVTTRKIERNIHLFADKLRQVQFV